MKSRLYHDAITDITVHVVKMDGEEFYLVNCPVFLCKPADLRSFGTIGQYIVERMMNRDNEISDTV